MQAMDARKVENGVSKVDGIDENEQRASESEVRYGISDTKPKRVKAYILENNEWKDTGTGFCVGKIEMHTEINDDTEMMRAYLIVNDEDSPAEVLLRSQLGGNIEYQRQEETLIVWKDINGRDIALSFEESVGCDTLCEFIVEVQRHVESNISLVAVKSNDNGVGSVHEIITGPVALPSRDVEQNEQTLMESLRILNENIAFEFLKNETVEFVLQTNYINLLIECFHKAESEQLLKELFLLGCIVKTLVLYNQRDILEQMVEDDKIYGIVGMLEYDTEFPTMKANHRKCLESYPPTCKEVVPIDNEDLKLIVKKCFRLSLLKDVVLVRFLDDHNFHLILDIILDLQTCIIGFLQIDSCLDKLLDLYDKKNDKEEGIINKRKDGIKLVHQCVQMSKNLDPIDKSKFYKTLVRKKLFKLLDYAFHVETDSGLRIMATDTIVTIIEHDILLIHNVQNEDYDSQQRNDEPECRKDLICGVKELNSLNDSGARMDMSLLLILSTILLTDKSPGLQEQVAQALHTLLHPDGCLSNGNENENSPIHDETDTSLSNYGLDREELGDENPNGNNGNASYFQIVDYFANFYKQVAPVIFRPLSKAGKSDEAKPIFTYDDNLLIHLVKLVSFICTEHDRRLSREFVLESGLLESVSEFIGPTHSLQLRLTAVRCLKNIMCLDDDYYHRYMISKELYRPIFLLLQENINKDNLANSCIQDFLKIISISCLVNKDEFPLENPSVAYKRTNFILLNKHVVQRYGDVLSEAHDIKFIEDMKKCYEEQITTEKNKWENGEGAAENHGLILVEETRTLRRSSHSASSDSDPEEKERHSFNHQSVRFKKVLEKINTVEPPSAILGELMRE